MALHPLRDRILAGTLCRHLRTKGMFVAGHAGPAADDPQAPDTAIFWCNASGWAAGPDGLPANPGRCGAGVRGCFEVELEA
jgi:hypothetical protein